MIDLFESTAKAHPDKVFFTFVDSSGSESSFTYRQTRLAAATLALKLQASGVRRGGMAVLDMPNSPAWVFFLLAAAYSSFTLVALNQRLSEGEKLTRLLELEREGLRVDCKVDASRAQQFIRHVRASLSSGGGAGGGRVIMGAQQDAMEEAVHFAERSGHLFDTGAPAVVMFTSGTTGRSKAVALSWSQLTRSAQAANRSLSSPGAGLWQATLPFFHIGGLQILVRSIVNRAPLRIYERFDAERVLADAEACHATHLSVVDKMLQDLIAVEEQRLRAEGWGAGAARGAGARAGAATRARAGAARAGTTPSRLALYQCILLGGGALNPQTIERASALGARVYASYGMTETSSQIANCLITSSFKGGLRLMEDYEARIVEPDAEGFGRLAVRGPGVFDGYLNARAAFTVDGFFLTGDVAAVREGLLYVKERTSDMFVSGGENIYPAEVVRALRRIEGVADAHVFGIPDETWGRRPAAVVERARDGVQVDYVKSEARRRLSKLTMPESLLLVDQLPCRGIGKIDRAAAEALFEQRLEVKRVILHHVRLPFREPFKTAKATLTHRDVVIVEVIDHAGLVGLGECVAFETSWYLPETLGDDERYLHDVLAPAVIGRAFSHPREVYDMMALLPGAPTHPMAISALEMALWDLHGRIQKQPLWALLRQEYARICQLEGVGDQVRALPCAASFKESQALVAAGAVVGMGKPASVVEAVRSAVNAGYHRVKMKIAPGQGLAAVRAVREAFPSLLITLDANGSFAAHDLEELRAYDELNVGWIEEPVDVSAPWLDGCGAGDGRGVHGGGDVLDARGGRDGRSGRGGYGVRGGRDGYSGRDRRDGCGVRSGRDGCGVRDTRGERSGRGKFNERPDALSRLAQVQRMVSVPVCVDESFVTADDAERILQIRELRCIAVKIAKFGGIEPALRFVVRAQARGCEVWMGGMYDTGISKRVHAAFQTLPGVIVPGDVGATARYFDTDITDPPHTCSRGYVILNPKGHELGIGCDFNLPQLARVLIHRTVVE